MSFSGTYRHNIDEKNRMKVPEKLRKKLGSEYCITSGLDGCLFVFTTQYFDEVFAKRLENLPVTDINVRNSKRRLISNKYDVEEDKQGRFVIPPELVKIAKIDKELVTIGVGDYIEVWAQDKYDEYNNSIDFEQAFGELAKFM